MKVPDGYPLVKGRFVTGFANSREAAIELMQVVPFLVEDMLKRTAASIRESGRLATHTWSSTAI